MNKLTVIGLVALVIIIGVFFITNNKTSQNSSQEQATQSQMDSDIDDMQISPTTASVEGTADTAQDDSTVKIVEVEAGSFYYKPNEIKVKKGEKVKIVMKSVSMMHDFNINELNVHMPVTQNGDTGMVEFTADKVGSFEYYCSVGQHRKMGQVGTLIVEE